MPCRPYTTPGYVPPMADSRSATVSNRIVDARYTGVLTAPRCFFGSRPRCATAVAGRHCRSSLIGSRRTQTGGDLRHLQLDVLPDVDDDRCRRFFQCGELARQQRGRHVVAAARGEPRFDGRRVTLQVDPLQFPRGGKTIAVCLAQCGAGEDRVPAARMQRPQFAAQSIKPRPAVLVGQGDARGHLRDVDLGMIGVGIEECPTEFIGQRAPDGCLTGTAHAHDDRRHEPLFSTRWPPKLLRIIASSLSVYSFLPWLAKRIIKASDNTGAGTP